MVSAEPEGRLLRLVIESAAVADGLRPGDSVAVRGACLTATRIDGPRIHFEAVRETLERTALGELAPGARVNLERALRADARLDGHVVQGHVDGVGRVRALRRSGDDVVLEVACGPELARHLVPKGSVAVDGVSLTVVHAGDDAFDVALIPHTLAATTLGSLAPGDAVNLEADVLSKYVQRAVERILGERARGGAA